MARKHQYKLTINGGYRLNAREYAFGSVKGVQLLVGPQKATVIISVRSRLSEEDILSFRSKVFRDAFRKVYLVHAIEYKTGLIPERIDIFIDDTIYTYDKNSPNFPFLFSMLDGNVNVDESWTKIIPVIINIPKYKMDNDLRMSAVFSYLAAQSRKYAIDRFSNLWTSMNAYYSYLNKCYEQHLKIHYSVPEEAIKKLSITAEADLIGAAVWQVVEKYKKFKGKEADDLWKGNYDVEKYLALLNETQIKELYDDSYAFRNDSSAGKEKYSLLIERAETFNLPLFTFLLFEYPYHYRCNYFHGNKSTLILMAYNDSEYYVLRTINYFLETFLKQEIPKLFADDFWTLERQEKTERYIASIKEEGRERKGFLKALANVKNAKEASKEQRDNNGNA